MSLCQFCSRLRDKVFHRAFPFNELMDVTQKLWDLNLVEAKIINILGSRILPLSVRLFGDFSLKGVWEEARTS